MIASLIVLAAFSAVAVLEVRRQIGPESPEIIAARKVYGKSR